MMGNPDQALLNGDERLAVRPFETFIKYMGSKAKILGEVTDALNSVWDGRPVCDLFSGTGILGGAIGDQTTVFANDIQHYASVLATTYLRAWRGPLTPTPAELLDRATRLVEERVPCLPSGLTYDASVSLDQFNQVETANRALIQQSFPFPWHLFLKYYSGTWWSAEQCLWIDALRQVIEEFRELPVYQALLASLLHAMAYCGQGTGHYAQYRDAKDEASMRDIALYRTKRNIPTYFQRKYAAILKRLPTEPSPRPHRVTCLDYRECLQQLEGPSVVYADPPYAFVHYSRFYHAIETLVLYDYPEIQARAGKPVKGRYRAGRHQSPFCIRSQVRDAFADLFRGVARSGSHLVLSYSNTGMLALEDIYGLARQIWGASYRWETRAFAYQHMTMGRRGNRQREVEESLLVARALTS